MCSGLSSWRIIFNNAFRLHNLCNNTERSAPIMITDEITSLFPIPLSINNWRWWREMFNCLEHLEKVISPMNRVLILVFDIVNKWPIAWQFIEKTIVTLLEIIGRDASRYSNLSVEISIPCEHFRHNEIELSFAHLHRAINRNRWLRKHFFGFFIFVSEVFLHIFPLENKNRDEVHRF